MITYRALRDRLAAGDGGVVAGLTRALEQIGWRSVREPSPEEMADHLAGLLEACVREHHDLSALTHAVATALRDGGPLLDGGLPPVEAYEPAAEELLRLFVEDAGAESHRRFEL
jgi:hypothetical protein